MNLLRFFKAEQFGLFSRKCPCGAPHTRAEHNAAAAEKRKPVQKPGSRGGHGYFNDHGVWVYGDRPMPLTPAIAEARGRWAWLNIGKNAGTEDAEFYRAIAGHADRKALAQAWVKGFEHAQRPKLTALTVEEATAMGRAARDRGMKNPPVLNAELQARLPRAGTPEWTTLVTAYSRGWMDRNLEDDAPDFPTEAPSPSPPPPAPTTAATRWPEQAKTFATDPKAKPWEVLEHDFIERGIANAIRSADYTAEQWDKQAATFADAKPGSKRETEGVLAKNNADYWRKEAAKLRAGDTERTQTKLRTKYRDTVKAALSQGLPVPLPVIAQRPEFALGRAHRQTYEKGHHTSFANESIAVDRSTVASRGFKTKRQDGKAITPAQIEEIATGVAEVEEALGPLKDVMAALGLTIAHTSGKRPFLSKAGGQYNLNERTITTGIVNKFTGQPIRSLAHEMGHFLDDEAGRLMGVKVRLHTKTAGSYDHPSLAQFDGRQYGSGTEGARMVAMAVAEMTDTYELRKIIASPTYGKDKSVEEQGEMETIRVMLGPYWREPHEVWARLTEEYVGTKLGRDGLSTRSAAWYAKRPGYWAPEVFERLRPMYERELARRLDVLRNGPQVIEGEKKLFRDTTRPLAAGEDVRVETDGVLTPWKVDYTGHNGFIHLSRGGGSMTARREAVRAR